MAVRRILTIDNAADLAVLKQHSRPVAAVDDDVRALMDDMLETMYAAPGIGLAAAQIGDLRRVVVMDLGDGAPTGDSPHAEGPNTEGPNTEGPVADEAGDEVEAGRHANPRFFANPEVVWASDEMFAYEEGCLSLPDYYDEVERPGRIRITYLDRDNQAIEEEIDGLYAVCFQHELDHLNGVLFIDHLSRLKRDRAVAKIKKSQRIKALEDA